MSDEDLKDEAEQPSLIEVDSAWKDLWKGMPDYSQQDLMPWQTVMVHFESMADRAKFAELVGQTINAKTKYLWYPKAKIEWVADKGYASTAPLNPRYPVYVPTKGRWESGLTINALEELGVPYFAVVQPQEQRQYRTIVKTGTILLLPEGLDGLVPARNWILDHATAAGFARHWQIDDNIRDFYRMHDNQKIRVTDGTVFRCMEDFVDRFENIAIAGPQYEMFAPRRQNIPPYILNTRVYSCSLISTTMGERYRDVYNDDTDICLRALKKGLCTLQFNAFLAKKIATMRVKGGNTPIYQGDGRRLMAESLQRQHPDCVTIVEKWGRIQHQVDYRRFRKNALKLREGVELPEGINNYGMAIVQLEEREQTELEQDEDEFAEAEAEAEEKPAPRPRPSPKPEPPKRPTASALDFLSRLAASQPQQEKAPVPEPPPAVPEPPSSEPVKPQPRREPPADAVPEQPFDHPEPEPEPPPTGAPEPAAPMDPNACSCLDFTDSLCPQHGDRAVNDLMVAVRAKGHKLFAKGDKLVVTDSSKLSDEERRLLRENKAAILPMIDAWVEPTPLAAEAPPLPEVPHEGAVMSGVLTATEGSIPSTAPDAPTQSVPAATISLFAQEPNAGGSLASFLGTGAAFSGGKNWKPDEPPILDGIKDLVLNFVTTGLNWAGGDTPVGVTVGTLDGQMVKFLPFAMQGGGNLDEAQVKRWYEEQVKNKHITNANTRFDVHMSRVWGVDLEEQGCTVSDVMHYAALLDDHRKAFALDKLVKDYLPSAMVVDRLDERRHSDYAAWEVAEREIYTAKMTAQLRNAMWPKLDAEQLQEVRQLEDEVIYPVVEMEKNGVVIDVPLMQQYKREVESEHNRLMLEIADEAGFGWEPSASGWKRLFEKVGLPASESYAENIVGKVDHPLVMKAHFAAQLASLNSKTFSAYEKLVDSEGILRFDINQLRGDDGGTVSGRFSIGYVQQVPNQDNHFATFGDRWFPRRIFVGGNGNPYLEADAMQIEYRLFAHFADNPQILAEYADDLNRLKRGEEPISFHKMTWARMKQHKPDMTYTNQKSFNFAKQYGARSVKLAVMMGFITEAEGEQIRADKAWNDPRLKQIHEIEAAYKKMMPEGDELLDRASHLAMPNCSDRCKQSDKMHRLYQHRGYVKTLLGRRSRFPNHYKTYIGLNRVLQGSGADIMKRKMVELHKERKRTGFLMRLTVHDAVGGDAQAGEETRKMVSEILNTQSFNLKVPILWGCNTGRTWADCK